MVHACPYTVTAGSYVLGALSPRESSEFHQHTEECVHCRREVVDLTPVAGFLAPLKVEWLAQRRAG